MNECESKNIKSSISEQDNTKREREREREMVIMIIINLTKTNKTIEQRNVLPSEKKGEEMNGYIRPNSEANFTRFEQINYRYFGGRCKNRNNQEV
jgi:hypothetical protein